MRSPNSISSTTEDPEDPEDPEEPENPEKPEKPENPEKPKEPEEPDNPKDPEVPEVPEVPERHGVFFLKRPMDNGEREETHEISGKNVVKPVDRVTRQQGENNQPRPRLEIALQAENTTFGDWAKISEMNGLGLRWGRIVTKRGPYPWELDSKPIVVHSKRPLCFKPMPIICDKCKRWSRLVGWWYQPEKDCCIYSMINNRKWRSK